jgi:hypothetical protein
MFGGKGVEGWGVEVGSFGGEVGGVGEREGERLGATFFCYTKFPSCSTFIYRW